MRWVSSSAVFAHPSLRIKTGRHKKNGPSSLAQPISDWIEGVVAERFEARNPITYAELLDLLEYHDSIAISADTLRHGINAIDSLKTVTGTAM
jgi:hypothetical protein